MKVAVQKRNTRGNINKQREIEQKKRKKRKKILRKIIILVITLGIIVFLTTSPTFKIQEISVKGNEQLDKEKILEIADLKIGDNIFIKNGKILEVKLKQNGYVESVKINKFYPSKIEIEISERQKQFQIKTETEKYIYIDEQGYILEKTDNKLDVPIITGMEINETEIQNQKRLEEKNLNKMENILQICEEFKKIEIENKITQIDLENEYVIYLENEGLTINLGNASNLKNRMYYVNAILKQESGNSGIIYVNGNLNEGFMPYFSSN